MKYIQKQQLIIIIVASILFIGFGVLRYYPLVKQKRNIEGVNEQQLVTFSRAKSYSAQLPLLRKHLDSVEQRDLGYDKQVPPDRQFAELWQEIASVMNRLDLKDQLVQPMSERTSCELNCIPISIKCSGSLRQAFELVRSLQNFERRILIGNVHLTNDQDYTGLLKMTIEANVYYQNGKSS